LWFLKFFISTTSFRIIIVNSNKSKIVPAQVISYKIAIIKFMSQSIFTLYAYHMNSLIDGSHCYGNVFQTFSRRTVIIVII
jgi:hypothetical protein